MMTCRMIVLKELRAQQEIADASRAPHASITRLLSIGLNTFYDIDRRAKREAVVQDAVEAQMVEHWIDLAG